MLSSSAPFIAVIDGDLQRDETLLPRMLETIKGSDVSIVVGSRYVAGGGHGDWDEARSVGAFADVGIASYIDDLETQWILASIAGIAVSAVWNHAVTRVYTWKAPQNA